MLQSSTSSFRILVASPNLYFDFDEYIKTNPRTFQEFVHFDLVRTNEEYDQLVDKYSYEAIIVFFGGAFMQNLLNDQTLNSKKLRWVHSLTSGVDTYLLAKDFAAADHIPLTNSKGAFSQGLAEFVVFGMLYHAKKLQTFWSQQQAKIWNPQMIELVHEKIVVIVGFGDIGACAGKIIKHGFGAKVIGLKRRPEITSDEHRSFADEIVGIDDLARVLEHADFVVNALPKTDETENFLSFKSCFSKMQKNAVFINVGRGNTVVEEDLIQALQNGDIEGAVLDVFQTEPLPVSSPLWKMPNVLIYPHTACDDKQHIERVMDVIRKNIDALINGDPLTNLVDKNCAY